MKRRHFILSILLAIPAATLAKFSWLKTAKTQKPFLIRADESRFNGEQKKAGNDLLRCVLSCEDTHSGMLMGTTTAKSMADKGGPPLHIHTHQDEILFVSSGEFLIQIGTEIFKAKAGDAAFIPRGTHHTFANPIADNPGLLISIHQPGDKQMEADFATVASGHFPKSWENDPTIVGPPIHVD